MITDTELRLVHVPRGETSGWIVFPLRPLGTVAGRPMLGGLKLLLGRFRLFNDAEDRRLPALLRRSREAQAAVSSALSEQVLGALHELLRGLWAAEPALIGDLAATRPTFIYEGLLTVLLRLVFLLYAEDRDLIPSRADPAARAFYDQGYSLRGLHARLLDDAARNPDTMEERLGGWGQMLALFRLLHAGDGTGWIRPRGGSLFDPDAFPFLEGRASVADPARIPHVTDGTVLRMLDGLVILKGERLSYRTLDVEQIGSVYETVMGFSVERAAGPVLAIRAGKHNRTPVFVDLAALATRKGEDRLRYLKEEAERGQIAGRQQKAIKEAVGVEGLAAALEPIADERGSPVKRVLPAGTPLLQPTEERRRTGSHYTPRTLTEPIVRYALEPAFERIGADAKPEQVLDLKVCDPAMGSGAFLVEACRQLATRLTQAWARWPNTRPAIPQDEDEDLHARRLVAQRCLYGVDRNSLAVDLARLSLWLATLARDHEFTFLDHALKAGDSLVGLTQAQIAGLRWSDAQTGLPLFQGFLRERVAQVLQARAEIREAADDVARAIQEVRHRNVESRLDDLRRLGDAVVATFFMADKERVRQQARADLEMWAGGDAATFWHQVAERVKLLREGVHPILPLHWETEFPEVFGRDNAGFDSIVGNPPFLGGKHIATENGDRYAEWLPTLHDGAHGNADLVAHFYRRAFGLLRRGGCFGLIATNTVGQGDTRETGLFAILAAGGSIQRAIRRLTWPGEAAVVVSVVHVLRGRECNPVLDGRHVRRISAYLVEGQLDASPATLAENSGKAFIGCIVLGMGFTFDDNASVKGRANSISFMKELISADPKNAIRILPYLGGEEVNTDPRQAYRRYVIDFFDFPLRRETTDTLWANMTEAERSSSRRSGVVPTDYPNPVAADWPDLLHVVERMVKPERDRLKAADYRRYWWQFGRKCPGMRAAVQELPRFLVMSRVSTHFAITLIESGPICAESLVIFAADRQATFGIMQSRVHELWAAFFSSSLKSDMRYGPSDCFETYPFPAHLSDREIETIANNYQDHRVALMVARAEGLTKIYNRFHDTAETAPDVLRLRELHRAMDVAVLRAYGWDDLADRAVPEFLAEDTEPDHRYQGRLFWSAPFRDVVLARLLELNAQRAAEERAAGLIAARAPADDELEDE